jgi:membrane protein insertase Oxa1/YidC/SpoIIIJ
MVLLFSRNFASGILVYWCTTNFMSLAQVAILNQPKVRAWAQIPELKRPNPADAPARPKRSLTESWEEFRLSNQVEDRSRILTEQAFARAATGPLRKTYKTDPTKKVE